MNKVWTYTNTDMRDSNIGRCTFTLQEGWIHAQLELSPASGDTGAPVTFAFACAGATAFAESRDHYPAVLTADNVDGEGLYCLALDLYQNQLAYLDFATRPAAAYMHFLSSNS